MDNVLGVEGWLCSTILVIEQAGLPRSRHSSEQSHWLLSRGPASSSTGLWKESTASAQAKTFSVWGALGTRHLHTLLVVSFFIQQPLLIDWLGIFGLEGLTVIQKHIYRLIHKVFSYTEVPILKFRVLLKGSITSLHDSSPLLWIVCNTP